MTHSATSNLHPDDALINILGVVYAHRKTSDGGDIYFTHEGMQYSDVLALENWYEKEWFREHRQRLKGTGAVYRVPTKTVGSRMLDLVVKNCRVGEDVPLDTHTLEEFMNAEFNSPWEEFSLVHELRDGRYGPSNLTIPTQDPLAIYVPPDKLQAWQTGRSVERISKMNARHPGIDFDILRQYKLIYGWIHGKSIVEVMLSMDLPRTLWDEVLPPLNRIVIDHMDQKGFAVADMKAEHIILSPAQVEQIEAVVLPDQTEMRAAQLAIMRSFVESNAYSVVDYELLLRTPQHEAEVKSSRRHLYLDDQRDRFTPTPLPPHLDAVEIMGVPYVHGHVESTGGQLWVVGRNGRLFDYFLPERWRKTPGRRLSENNDIFYTLTKDNIHLVWKTSRVGELPKADGSDAAAPAVAASGFNSPFEEFGIAFDLNFKGIPTVYIRAIYMTGAEKQEQSLDLRRYESHARLQGADGLPILRQDHNYITIRGFFNGPDTWVAAHDLEKLYKPVSLFSAQAEGTLDPLECARIFARVEQNLLRVGYDGTLLRLNDILLAKNPDGGFDLNDKGEIEARICNFELIRKV